VSQVVKQKILTEQERQHVSKPLPVNGKGFRQDNEIPLLEEREQSFD